MEQRRFCEKERRYRRNGYRRGGIKMSDYIEELFSDETSEIDDAAKENEILEIL